MVPVDALPVAFFHGLSFILGLICGSFVSAVSYRLPRGENFVSGRSRCPKCQTDLSGIDLIPVLSWLLFAGRCRHCKAAISVRYPATELICGGLFLLISLSTMPDQTGRSLVLAGLAVVLLTLSITDLEVQRLPNSLIVVTAGLALGHSWIVQASLMEAAVMGASALIMGLVGRLAGQLIAQKPGIGWGDIKLAGVLLLCVPRESLVVFLGVFGVTAIFLAVLFGWRLRREAIPLGPALCAGAFASLI